MGQLIDALVEAIGPAYVRTGVAVTDLEARGGGYRLGLGAGSTLEAAAVVLAAPARTTARLLAPVVPEAAAAIGGIAQVSTSTVTLVYRAADVPELSGTGFLVPAAQGRKVTGVTFLSNKWPGRVPDDRFVMLRAFVGGRHGQQAATCPRDQLVEIVRAELAEMLDLRADPVLTRVFQWVDGLHRYTLGHLDRVRVAEAALDQHPGLVVAGAAFHGIGLNECVDSAAGRRCGCWRDSSPASRAAGGSRPLPHARPVRKPPDSKPVGRLRSAR